MYNTRISITLRPEGQTPPTIRYGLDTVSMEPEFLVGSKTIDFDIDMSEGEHKLIVYFENKTNETSDQAVIIESVTVEGMTLDRFKWAGKYYPVYPEPWASEQTEPLPAVRECATYLGWNGCWELKFTVPIFTWIHKIENLGWIYS